MKRNHPVFPDERQERGKWFSPLDALGRVGPADCVLTAEDLPTDTRRKIPNFNPTGWQNTEYSTIIGRSLYVQSDLVPFALCGENDNPLNRMTGTHDFDQFGIRRYEMYAHLYLKDTGGPLRYYAMPVFCNQEKLARGFCCQPAAWGKPGPPVYAGSEVWTVPSAETTATTKPENQARQNQPAARTGKIFGNKNSKIYHLPGDQHYEQMRASRNLVIFDTEEEAQAAGYQRAKK